MKAHAVAYTLYQGLPSPPEAGLGVMGPEQKAMSEDTQLKNHAVQWGSAGHSSPLCPYTPVAVIIPAYFAFS